MRRYFINYELKISTTVILVIMALFLLITSFGLKLHNDKLKADYIKSLGVIAERVIENFIREIPFFVTKLGLIGFVRKGFLGKFQ